MRQGPKGMIRQVVSIQIYRSMDEDTALTLDNHHVFTRWWLLGSEEEKEKKKKQNWPLEIAANHLVPAASKERIW